MNCALRVQLTIVINCQEKFSRSWKRFFYTLIDAICLPLMTIVVERLRKLHSNQFHVLQFSEVSLKFSIWMNCIVYDFIFHLTSYFFLPCQSFCLAYVSILSFHSPRWLVDDLQCIKRTGDKENT